MTVRERVFGAFKESFDLDDGTDTSKLVYQDYPAWTSIGHMILVAALESEFDTMLETRRYLSWRCRLPDLTSPLSSIAWG